MEEDYRPSRQEFVNEVMEEIKHLKRNATKSEKRRLNFDTFIYSHPLQCIYGQLTGNCSSRRALELYPKTYAIVNLRVGSKDTFEGQSFLKGIDYTPLEKYLYMVDIHVRRNILEFIKGVSTQLTLR